MTPRVGEVLLVSRLVHLLPARGTRWIGYVRDASTVSVLSIFDEPLGPVSTLGGDGSFEITVPAGGRAAEKLAVSGCWCAVFGEDRPRVLDRGRPRAEGLEGDVRLEVIALLLASSPPRATPSATICRLPRPIAGSITSSTPTSR